MNDLLNAVREVLLEGLDSAVYRAADIYIAVAEDDPPVGMGFPAVGIKDGGETVFQKSCDVDEVTQRVKLVLWAAKSAGSGQVQGDATQPGVLGSEKDVERALRYKPLPLPGEPFGYKVASSASEQLVSAAGKVVQQKIVTFEFMRERQWDTN